MKNEIKKVTNIVDADRCDELLTKLIQDERKYNDIIDENYKVKNHFNKMLDDDNIILLAYYIDKLIVGYILVRKIEDNICLLDGLYVEEQYRNNGIGNLLLNEAISQVKKLNIKYVDINVMYNNIIAKRIYKKIGFSEYEIKMRKEI